MELKLPMLGENITQGTVTKILIKPGDAISKGQNILELETDKAVLEVPSPQEGIVSAVLVKAGDVVQVGAPVFTLGGSAPMAPAATKPEPAPKAFQNVLLSGVGNPEMRTAGPPTKTFRGDSSGVVAKPAVPAPLPARANVSAAPSVRLFAREIGIDIAQIPGSGPGGRISIDDVKKYAKALNASRPSPAMGGAQPLPDFGKWGPVRREAMNNVRRKTAEHLSHAWQNIPHVTQFEKTDITELEKLRKRFSNKEKKLSITPFIIKVIAAALKHFPQFNASVDMTANEIVYKDYVHIGVAVDTDRGLLVPVLKNVDKMSIMQISDELGALAQRARARKATMEEMQGGCFTISNLGGIGGTFFTPIVNWPEAAILGVSRGVMEPVYMENQFVPRLMLPLSLSYDHRLIDGADGARFIRWVADAIQQPFLIDLEK